MPEITRRRFMIDGAKVSAAVGMALAFPQKSYAYSTLPTKFIVSSDSRYFYHLDKNFQNTQAPIHRSNVIPSAHTGAPLDTVFIDPVKGPEYLWAATEHLSSAPDPRQVYSFHVVDGVVSNVQGHDVSHLNTTTIEVESMCIDAQNRRVILADNPRMIYICDENFALIKSIDLNTVQYYSSQGICYVPWLDGYLISDNYTDRLLVLSEDGDVLWEVHLDRLDPVPTNPQGIAVDYATRDIYLSYYQTGKAIVRLNWGGIQQDIFPNTLWEPTITNAVPTSIAIVQEPFRFSAD